MAKNTPDFAGSVNKQYVHPALEFLTVPGAAGSPDGATPKHDNDNYHDNDHGNDKHHGNDTNSHSGRRPVGREPMTRRVVVLFTPSKYNRLRAEADKQGISFNELINVLTEGVKSGN
jgi:hypothetical protein